MTLQWSNKTMYVTTNSSVLGVVFDSSQMSLSISVGGPNGTTGFASISVPMEMLSGLSAVRVMLDDQPIEFEISQVGNYARIYVEYHHSYHELTAHLRGTGFIGDLEDALGGVWVIIAIIIVAIVVTVAVLLLLRKRTDKKEEKKE